MSLSIDKPKTRVEVMVEWICDFCKVTNSCVEDKTRIKFLCNKCRSTSFLDSNYVMLKNGELVHIDDVIKN